LDEVAMLPRANDGRATPARLGCVLINRDCSAIAPAANDLYDCAENSGDLLPTSPPSEQATAREDQAGQASTGDWPWNGVQGNAWGFYVMAAIRRALTAFDPS
jgi:hypothetical protein